MCMPIGHIMAALNWFIVRKYPEEIKNWSFNEKVFSVLLFIFFSNVQDLDYLPYAITGDPRYYSWHHGWTHSIGGAIISVILWKITFEKRWKKFCSFSDIWWLYLTHLILDFFTFDFTSPIGIPLFWPISNRTISFPVSIFCFFFKWFDLSIARHCLLSKPAFFSYLWELVVFSIIGIFVLIYKKTCRSYV